jgi:predicted ATPase
MARFALASRFDRSSPRNDLGMAPLAAFIYVGYRFYQPMANRGPVCRAKPPLGRGIANPSNGRDRGRVIASIAFRNFKALRNTQVALAPFNLIIGPNGSGKTSLIQAVIGLRDLARLRVLPLSAERPATAESPEIRFRFAPPFAEIEARLGCASDFVCNLLEVSSPSPEIWERARAELLRARSYFFDPAKMAQPADATAGERLASNGENLAAVLAWRRAKDAEAVALLEREFCRLFPEFSGLDLRKNDAGLIELGAALGQQSRVVRAENLSQGTLFALAILAVVLDPLPPSIVCLEEIDRGMHPRMLREIQDALYRLSYPRLSERPGNPVLVLATTHSPYMLDLFRDHPEEVIIAQKEGQEARFERLGDRADLKELLQEGSLGDMWYAGILGGVPDEAR